MPFVSWPVGTLLIALAVLISLALWLRRDRNYPGPHLESSEDGIDHEELDAAQREVRDLDSSQRPEDRFAGDDWGPGASRPRPPERL